MDASAPITEDARSRSGALQLALAASICLLALAFGSTPARADATLCTPTGNETVTTDKPDYPPESSVHISGSGYAAGCQVTVKVTRPDGSVVLGDGTATPGSDTVL